MKAPRQYGNPVGFSLVEMLTVIAIIGIVAAMLLTVLSRAETRAKRVSCINNLREMGIAFHEFSDDHDSKYPMQVPISEGGSQEYLEQAETLTGNFYFAYRFFQTLSNFLINPQLLICPNDNRYPTNRFELLRNDNLSYFSTAFARVGDANGLLAGDRNLTNDLNTPQSRLLFTPVKPLHWTAEMHQFRGNVLFADDHVEEWNNQNSNHTFNAVMIFPPIVRTFISYNPPNGPGPGSPPGNPPGNPPNAPPGNPPGGPPGPPPGSPPGSSSPSYSGNPSAPMAPGMMAPGNAPGGTAAMPNTPMNPPMIMTPPPAANPNDSNVVGQFLSNSPPLVSNNVPAVTNAEPTNPPVDTNFSLAPKKVAPPESGFPWWLLWLLLSLLLLFVLYVLIVTYIRYRKQDDGNERKKR